MSSLQINRIIRHLTQEQRDKIPKLLENHYPKPAVLNKPKKTTKLEKDPLVIRKWFNELFSDYKNSGANFSRLNWIVEQLAAATMQYTAGNYESLEKITKRIPPPDQTKGEMAVQTEKTRTVKPKRTIDTKSISVMKDLYATNRTKAFEVITGNDNVKCKVDTKEVEKYFKNTTKVTSTDPEDLEFFKKVSEKTGISVVQLRRLALRKELKESGPVIASDVGKIPLKRTTTQGALRTSEIPD